MPQSERSRLKRQAGRPEPSGVGAVLAQGAGIALAAISLLAFIGIATRGGVVAGAVGGAFAALFGQPAWLASLVLLAVGALSLVGAVAKRRIISGPSVVLAGVALAALSAVSHLATGLGSQPSGPAGGGILGRIIGWNLVLALGYPGAYVLLIPLIIVPPALAVRGPEARLRLIAAIGRAVILAFRATAALAKLAVRWLESRKLPPLKPGKSPKAVRTPAIRSRPPGDKWEQVPLIKIKTSLAEPPQTGESGSAAAARQDPPDGKWRLPSVDLLMQPDRSERISEIEIAENAAIIESTLASFGVEAKVAEAVPGPVVTQYCLRPGAGVKVSRIGALSNDLALALSAKSIRLEAPVPGRPFVGLELPNRKPANVTLRELIESQAYAALRAPLRLLLGKDVADEAKIGTLTAMPHLLIAGSTGAGKSVFLNSLILSLLFQHTPDELRLILIDPKMVELVTYNDIPHLIMPVVVQPDQVVSVLAWASQEMGRRFKLLAEAGQRHIRVYNEQAAAAGEKRLPYLVIIVDELADLMMTAPADVERQICRLAQMARAVGIHLVISTQRPSVDVVTGLIKANFPTRVAFMVSSQVDSRTILDSAGAEKLVGRGDMLFAAPDSGKLIRIQGALATDEEIQRVVKFWLDQGRSDQVSPEQIEAAGEELDESEVELLDDAIAIVRQHSFASAALLQRELQVGFTKAQKLIAALEKRGVVAPPTDGRPSREVLPEAAFAAEDPN